MPKKSKDEILHDHNNDGIDRRGFLKCMAWAGTGALCVMEGGILKSYSLSRLGEFSAKEMAGELSFVQISDSHMGFNKPANPDVAGTLKAAVEKASKAKNGSWPSQDDIIDAMVGLSVESLGGQARPLLPQGRLRAQERP